ncbi:MAG: ABC-F family ATP-binding cassette domain-containing protein [Propionibacteriaceae bacterium]|nr:ABC-F family ATP-binding cassette domain-containing protein [Propionibacteriaceae bacterium]
MAHLLSGEKIGLEYPNRQVFGEVTCGIDEGDRVGIVGRNGDGKSSLLAILAGALAPTAGQVRRRNGVRVGRLGQGDELASLGSIRVEQAVFGQRERYEWASKPAMRGVVDGLLARVDLDSDIAELSGGERRKVALAALLVGDWDVLALDEPTNHLDLEAIAWLAGHLKTRWPASKGGLLVVTHDRWFLDEVVTGTWEVHDGMVEPFSGGYAAYVLARVERDRQAAAIETKRRNLMRKELAWLRRGAPARTSKPRFHVEAANALIEDVPQIRDSIGLSQMAVARLGKRVIDLEDVSFRYPVADGGDTTGVDLSRTEVSPWVLRDVTWRIAPGERTGVLGANGAGKSTLLGLIDGGLLPVSGRVRRGQTVRLAVLDQTYSTLDETGDELVRDVVGRLKTTFQIEGRDVGPTQLLERLGFTSDHLSTPVGDLSGGQKRRLQLLLILCEEPNVLILDEPTNDIDTDTLTALEDLLDTWPGCLIVVSHDRYFIERVTDQQYAVMDAHLRHLPGGIDEYVALMAAEDSLKTLTKTGSTPSPSDANEDRLLRKRLATVESRLGKAERAVTEAMGRLSQADQSDWHKLEELMTALSSAKTHHDELEQEWLELADRLG